MTSQMSEMQREVDDKLKTEGALKTADQARKEVSACYKLHAALQLMAVSSTSRLTKCVQQYT